MNRKRARELTIEELDTDDIGPIPEDIRGSPLSQAADNIETEEEADDVLKKMRDGLISTLLKNPFLKVEEKTHEGVTLINSLSEEQLKSMEYSFRNQLSEVVDRGVTKNISDTICAWIPYVDREKFRKGIADDKLFQQAFNNLISVKLCETPDTFKIAFLAGVHFVRCLNGRSTIMAQSTIIAPVPDVDMREVEQGEEHSDSESGDEDALL